MTGRDRPKGPALLVCALPVLGLAGCGDGDVGYFPLEDNWRWGYRVTIGTEGSGDRSYRFFVVNLPRQTLADAPAVPRLAHDGRVHYYATQADGVRHVASRAEGDELTLEPPGQYVLRQPFEPGTKWQVASRTYLLKKHALFDTMAPIEANVELEYTIETVDAVVSTLAGEFAGCLKVRGLGSTSFTLGPDLGKVPVSIETVGWFAPGVGLVKMERRESSYPENPGNVRIVQELEVFDKGSWFD
jgi:hypothetical protein